MCDWKYYKYNMTLYKKLPNDYIAGLVDGEGCFALKFRRDVRHERKGNPTYYYWTVEFAILLHGNDLPLLELVQKSLGCGKISISKENFARYSVNKFTELQKIIIPFFQDNKFYGKKYQDFILWKEAVNIIVSASERKGQKFEKVNFSVEELERLKKIYYSMREFKGYSRKWKWIDKQQGRVS